MNAFLGVKGSPVQIRPSRPEGPGQKGFGLVPEPLFDLRELVGEPRRSETWLSNRASKDMHALAPALLELPPIAGPAAATAATACAVVTRCRSVMQLLPECHHDPDRHSPCAL